MPNEIISCPMRYYTIGYNRILHYLISSSANIKHSGSIGRDYISYSLPQNRAAAALSKNVLKYCQDVRIRTLASEIQERHQAAANSLSELAPLSRSPESSAQDISRFTKSIMCINNCTFADMSERRRDLKISSRYIREILQLLRGTAEAAALVTRYDINEQLRCFILSQTESADDEITKTEEIYFSENF